MAQLGAFDEPGVGLKLRVNPGTVSLSKEKAIATLDVTASVVV